MPKLEQLQWKHVNNDKTLFAAVHINGVYVKCLRTCKEEGGTTGLKKRSKAS